STSTSPSTSTSARIPPKKKARRAASPCLAGVPPASVLAELEHVGAVATGQQAAARVDAELGARVGDVQVAHGELANAVQRREGRVFDLLHRQALGRVGEVGALGVEDGVVVAAAQLDGDLTRDRARHPALRGFAQHDGLGVEPAALVEQAAELQAIDAV